MIVDDSPDVSDGLVVDRTTVLLNVPIDARFRHTLRIYDVDAVPNRELYIFVYVMGERSYHRFFHRRFEVPAGNGGGPGGLPPRPEYIQVGSDEVPQRVNVAGAERIYYSLGSNDSNGATVGVRRRHEHHDARAHHDHAVITRRA